MTRKKKQKDVQTRFPIKDVPLELRIVRQSTKELVAFDFGLMFEKDSNTVQVYVDDMLRESINGLLALHGKLIMKVNAFSPDVFLITPAD